MENNDIRSIRINIETKMNDKICYLCRVLQKGLYNFAIHKFIQTTYKDGFSVIL